MQVLPRSCFLDLSGLFSGKNSAKHSVLANNRQAQILQTCCKCPSYLQYFHCIYQVFCCPCARSLHSTAFQWINDRNSNSNLEDPKAWDRDMYSVFEIHPNGIECQRTSPMCTHRFIFKVRHQSGNSETMQPAPSCAERVPHRQTNRCEKKTVSQLLALSNCDLCTP